MAVTAAPRMEWTGDPEADALVASNHLALLIGFCLDQQVSVQKAFVGPLEVRRRLGTLDARRLSRIDPARFDAAFRERPAIHRFPSSMAQRVQALCTVVSERYGNDASRIWTGAADAEDLMRRLRELPGFGDLKARIVLGVIGKHFKVRPRGWKALAPDFPTLADVRTVAQREQYQAGKRAHKQALRSAQVDTRRAERDG